MRWLCTLLIGGCSFSVGASSHGEPDGTVAGDGRIDAPATDAATIDAPHPDAAFDPATCPSSYTTTLAATPLSRYRFILVDRPWLGQHQDCADDLPGATHLAVLDTTTEAQQLAAAATGSVYYQVGAAQAPGQTTLLGGWYQLTGEAVPTALWQAGQPNDNDGIENGEQNRGSVNTTAGPLIQDIDSGFATHGVCECDGKPISPTVSAFL